MRNVYFVVSGTVRENFEDFSMARGIGCMLNPFDFFYHEDSKCSVRAQTPTTVLQFQAKYIHELLDKYPEFRKRWLKSIFIYALKSGRGLDFLEKAFAT